MHVSTLFPHDCSLSKPEHLTNENLIVSSIVSWFVHHRKSFAKRNLILGKQQIRKHFCWRKHCLTMQHIWIQCFQVCIGNNVFATINVPSYMSPGDMIDQHTLNDNTAFTVCYVASKRDWSYFKTSSVYGSWIFRCVYYSSIQASYRTCLCANEQVSVPSGSNGPFPL